MSMREEIVKQLLRKQRETVAAPAIVKPANPTPADILNIKNAAAQYGRKPWPEAQNPLFPTTPEAYAETTKLVPQVSIKGKLPGPLPGEDLPLKGRAEIIAENTEPIANRIAKRLAPMVKQDSELLKFYHTGPVMSGLVQTGGLKLPEANLFMRDWSGQGAGTSMRTSTPPNLRNASLLLYERARGTPMTPERFAVEGNIPGYTMMGEHVKASDRFARDVVDPWKNPKPFTYRENWSGNLRDVTADTHNIRSTLFEADAVRPGQLPRQWFVSDEAFKNYRDAGGFRGMDKDQVRAMLRGEIKDELGGVTVNKVPRQSEYGVITAPWYRAAEKLGRDPAEIQSGGWFNYGPLTGLASPPKTIPNLLNDQLEATAKAIGRPNEQALEWWARRQIPLAGVGGAAAAPALGELVQQDQY
jgi:hypothetical protein